jgi:OPA family glycerol-3-phosphate transporter-like MFS transporter/OPA family sugar phosphate sensor protein UhpC-like MFS transporter
MVLNNIFQGCGFPPCNRLITHWVPPHELATKMSIWNASHSIGAFIIAVLCGYIMGNMGTDMTGNEEMRARIAENTAKITESMDPAAAQAYVDNALQHVGAWQWAFWIPAIIGLFGVLFIITVLRDTPKSVGLPELAGTKTELDGKEETSAEFKEFLRKKVFMNPIIWILAISDFFVYIVRFAILDWGPTFLQESRGLSSEMAGWTVAIFEVMGVCGMLTAGVISDKLFKGRSQRTCVFCMLGVLIFISLFVMLPETTNPTLLLAFLAISGFFIYGPQALIGVIASNQATKKAASTANGVVGFVSYISVAVSGVGFGFISDNFGWQWVFITMIIIAVLGLFALLTLWNVKSDGYDHDDEKVVEAEVKSIEEIEAVSAE